MNVQAFIESHLLVQSVMKKFSNQLLEFLFQLCNIFDHLFVNNSFNNFCWVQIFPSTEYEFSSRYSAVGYLFYAVQRRLYLRYNTISVIHPYQFSSVWFALQMFLCIFHQTVFFFFFFFLRCTCLNVHYHFGKKQRHRSDFINTFKVPPCFTRQDLSS